MESTLTLAIFTATYIALAAGHVYWFRLDRSAIALVGAIALLAVGSLTLQDAVASINFPSMLMLFGLFVIAAQLQRAGFYHGVAGRLTALLDRPARFLLLLMIASGALSAFLNNDVVCFAFTPIVGAALVRKRVNPVPFLIAIALASNIGCAATLIGNAQDILIGQIGHLDFGRYMLFALPPVVLSMAAAYGLVWRSARRSLQLAADAPEPETQEPTEPFDKAQAIKGLVVTAALVILFFTPLPRYLVALVAAAVLLTSHTLKSKKILKLVDWQLFILFFSLFVLVGALRNSGWADEALRRLTAAGVDLRNPFVLMGVTGVLSNLINNSAAVMLLVNLIDLSDPLTGYVLALANTFGGNLLLIGSVANLVMAKEANAAKVSIGFGAFARLGIPVTLVSYAVLAAWVVVFRILR